MMGTSKTPCANHAKSSCNSLILHKRRKLDMKRGSLRILMHHDIFHGFDVNDKGSGSTRRIASDHALILLVTSALGAEWKSRAFFDEP